MDCNTFQKANLWTHVHAVKQDETAYMKELTTSMESLSTPVKGTCFAALHLTGKHKALNSTIKYWDIASLYKMLTYLDAPRQLKQLTKKIQKIERQHPHLLCVEDNNEENGMAESNSFSSSKRKKKPESKEDAPEKKRRRRPRKIDDLRIQLKKLQGDFLEGNRVVSNNNKKQNVDSSVTELIESASVSGSLARKIRTLWAPTQKADYLEFVMLEMPKKTVWRYVADLVHFKPSDFSVDYFLADIFDESIPKDSFVCWMRKLMESSDDDELVTNFQEVAAEFPQIYKSYAFLRNQNRLVRSREVVELLAAHIPVETAIWYFEELYSVSPLQVSTILTRRLGQNDLLSQIRHNESKVFTFGKLLERLLTFQKLGQTKLATLLLGVAAMKLGLLKEKYGGAGDCHTKKAVAVFGDASSSMQTAIEAAAIIASIISTTLDGELSFFASGLVKSPHLKPSSVTATLKVCQTIQASGCTNLAACLWPYFDQNKVVDTIVLVTDEYENTKQNGYYFADLLAAYRNEVNPNVVLVVVRVGTGSPQFQRSLEQHGIEPNKVVIIDDSRPDLTKFDGLVGQIAAASHQKQKQKQQEEVVVEVVPQVETTNNKAQEVIETTDHVPSSSTEEEDFVLVDA
ncbi:unnamed protein product [Cylindrotheca closterium]|uniref:TROVE domain-containing protein n=1 Tax=Cylindrotheca closterium TaxID=2856 RepID=A0AAD2FPC8_9STRA|nr:unnamed protein product [Cylindrotheca closterium]